MGLPWLWITGLLASALVSHQILKPRLPIYKIQPLVGFPKLTWDSSQYMLGMPMSVSMYNENYLEIDVYSLSFDIFYMNGDGSLLHVADIRDHNQASQTRGQTSQGTKLSTENQMNTTERKEALWQIPCRKNFTINDMLYMGMDSGIVWNLLGNSNFYSNLWRGSGSFWMPTTGVAHVKATQNLSLGIPATIYIICDNKVENLVVEGLSCVLHDAQPGWADLKVATQNLRSHATSKLKANENGMVLNQATLSKLSSLVEA